MERNKTAELLVQLRKEKKYTQQDLADRLDVTYQAVSKWERGENLPDAYSLLELGKIYGITVDEILNGKLNHKEDIRSTHKKKMTIIIIAIMMIIISPVSIFIFGDEQYQMYVPIILVITAISVGLMIYAANLGNRSIYLKSKKVKQNEQIIYTFCVAIFLFLGLVYNLFQVAWIVFIVGYAITLIVNKES